MSEPHKAMATNTLGTARPSSQWDHDKEAPKSARAGVAPGRKSYCIAGGRTGAKPLHRHVSGE